MAGDDLRAKTLLNGRKYMQQICALIEPIFKSCVEEQHVKICQQWQRGVMSGV